MEISNGYGKSIEAEIMIVDDTGTNISEVHKIKLYSGMNKKLSFTNVKSPCSGNCDFKIYAKLQ